MSCSKTLRRSSRRSSKPVYFGGRHRRPLSCGSAVRFGWWSQPVDATPGGQLAINTDDGLPNARPIAFGDSPRNQLSHNTIFSAAPCHYEVTDLSSYTLYLFPLR